MKRLIWIALSLCLSTAISLAQETCPVLDSILLSALEHCEDAETGSLCYGANVSLQQDAEEEIEFEASGDTVALANVIAFETTSDDAVAMLHLNREDVALRIVAMGEAQIQNTAPRSRISVYALRGVNLRQSPSAEAIVIGSLPQGRDYTAVGRLADNTWIQVQLDDNRIGWSSAQYFVTRDGFTELEVVTPTTPPYLPMQSLTLHTGDCGALLLQAPELDEETIIFGINGAQIHVTGIVWVQANEDTLTITSIEGEQIINAFGFEVPINTGEWTSIPLSASASIAGIPSDAQSTITPLLDEETITVLTGDDK